jgi:hypothetical protein
VAGHIFRYLLEKTLALRRNYMAIPIPAEDDVTWLCPLLHRRIAQGLCLDVNYELLNLAKLGVLGEVHLETGKTTEEIASICEACPNQPLR